MKNTNIESVISLLEYNNSKDLYYNKKINYNSMDISLPQIKCLKEINPYAIYCKENKPFIIFIDGDNINSDTNKKIWNMQIPVVMLISDNIVKIYDGSNLDIENKKIELIEEESIKDLKKNKKFSFWDISNIDFLQKNCKESNNLNKLLLKNINFLTKELKEKYNIKFATKLVLRIIFIRFLIDKGIDIDYVDFTSNINSNKEKFIEITRDRDKLYKLFKHLKEKFNGNLFDIENESDNINENAFKLISDFISAKQELENGQISFFDMYDFDIISISLISAIYEIILGEDKQKNDKAFYTPDYLVKYLLKDINLKENENFKVLDPSCGSGIFLVEMFQKILMKNIEQNGYINDDEKINKLLTNNIYGIDINDEAIDISIFSLYLVIMEYKNPKTLQNYKFPTIKNSNLIVADFFDENKTKKILNNNFDLVIGNPPWGSIRESVLHKKFCIERNIPIQNNEISRSFLFKVKEICKENTLCCLVLPSSLLYNIEVPARESREMILKQVKIEKIIEMSSVRKLLFENATAPTFCMFFRKDNSDYLNNKIKYITLKPNVFFKLFNSICIEKDDVKYVVQKFLIENDWAWKTILYGTFYDIHIILNLNNNYKTIQQILDENEFICGTGIAMNDGDKKDATHLIGKKLLNARTDIDSFYVNTNTKNVFQKKYVHRIPSMERFKAPFVLIKKGINTRNFKMRAAFCEEDALFTNAITSISSRNANNNEKLLNIVGLLNSSLYAYLNLMLASSIGIEREQHYKSETLEKPYIYSNEIVQLTNNIIKLKNKNAINNYEIEDKVQELDKLILQKFDLLNNEAIDYALNITIPQITNLTEYNYVPADLSDLKKYSSYFLKYFNELFDKEKYAKVILYPNLKGIISIFELYIVDEKPENDIQIYDKLDNVKKKLSNLILNNIDDIIQSKEIIDFEENSFYIIKTNECKNWHPLKAKIDLEEILNTISLSSEEEGCDE